MDKLALGARVVQAREDASVPQESLAQTVGSDRTAISRLEAGERKLVATAEALGRPLSHFVEPPVPAAVSRREDSGQAHETTRALDATIEDSATDVRTLLRLGPISSGRTVGRTDSRQS